MIVQAWHKSIAALRRLFGGRRETTGAQQARDPAGAQRSGAQPLTQVARRNARPTKEPTMEKAKYILDQFCGYLEKDDVGYGLHEQEPVLRTGIEGETGYYRITVFVHNDVLAIATWLPVIVPVELRKTMAEAVNRANDGLLMGSFRLNMSNGHIVYQATMPIGDGELGHDQYRTLMGASIATPERYMRAFYRLVYGDDLSPAEVIAEVELGDD